MSSPDLPIDDRLTIPGEDLEVSFSRASGPGGQRTNKVATRAELRFDVDASEALDEATKARLRSLAGRRLGADGVLQLVPQATRSQSQNLSDVRQRLAELIREALKAPRERKPTRPSRAARQRRLSDKRRQSLKKRSRSQPPVD